METQKLGSSLPVPEPQCYFTVSEHISGIALTDSLGHGNQVPCVWMGRGVGWQALKSLYLPASSFLPPRSQCQVWTCLAWLEFGSAETELALYEVHLLTPFV